ncbi:glycosyltransferase family 2 protein [Psittacicella gerlachiana]|uniref:Glycosyltransferase 2-like domain-containing protein n=1 Tax=Psittacicella gerlachiana TaxID=2028574 RepID=A0A3A1YBA1_9GAMM|nr:glycosyltransferase family A protein [Psittacicella gerlachiana]RIY35583.1 hypothetical protein CKF59_03490 [Psittacicella gerlachiana]
MSLFSQANELLRQGQYQQALSLYYQIALTYQDLELVSYNIELCWQHLGLNPEGVKSLTLAHIAILAQRQQQAPVDALVHQQALDPQTLAFIEQGINAPEILYTPEQVVNVAHLYQQVAHTRAAPLPVPGECPLVSVIMTCHNTGAYIEQALNSLLLQTYPNLEILVIDDHSSDNTFAIVERMAKAYPQIRPLRLNTNLGTYYAKNLGITQAKGQIIFFHDSDDVCHHERISRCVAHLRANPQAKAVRCAYARVETKHNNIVRLNNYVYKLGLITLGIKKEVFKEIGFFNCTMRASDDEFFHRMVKYYGREKIAGLMLPLYFNTMRADSLFTDMVEWHNSFSISQELSPMRARYIREFKQFQTQTAPKDYKHYFTFPRIRDVYPLEAGMSKLANPKLPVYVSICSIPSRERQLANVVQALSSQVDYFHFYLDGYKQIPSFIKELGERAQVILCKDKSQSLRDNGKFILLEQLLARGEDAYYFTCDDDIVYPLDYVNTLLHKLAHYQDQAVVGVHGVIIPSSIQKYFSSQRLVYNFYKGLEQDRAVNILGTGTLAFRVSKFKEFKLSNFATPGMVDIYFAIYCKEQGMLQVAVQRYAHWLSEDNGESQTLFAEYQFNDHKQTQLIQTHLPWGFTSIKNLIGDKAELQELLPTLNFYLN